MFEYASDGHITEASSEESEALEGGASSAARSFLRLCGDAGVGRVRLGGGVGLVWDLNGEMNEMKLVSENEAAIDVSVTKKKKKRLDCG